MPNGTYTVNGTNGYLTLDGSNPAVTLNVQVSGTVPSSGKLRYTKNVLDGGCLVIGDYKITFKSDGSVDQTEKGDCTGYTFPASESVTLPVQYGYKSFDIDNYEETEIAIGTSGYTVTGKHAYLKYALTSGEVENGTVPDACVYNDGRELCLAYGESNYNSNVEKMNTYFGYDEDTWTKIDDHSWENPSHTITWNYGENFTHFFDSIVDANTHPDGYVSAGDFSGDIAFICYVSNSGNGCYYDS